MASMMGGAPFVPPGCLSGTFKQDNGKFGFIAPDDGGPEVFVMPNGCKDFGETLPPIGTPVIYTLVVDKKTGRPRAEEVMSQQTMQKMQKMQNQSMQNQSMLGMMQEAAFGALQTMFGKDFGKAKGKGKFPYGGKKGSNAGSEPYSSGAGSYNMLNQIAMKQNMRMMMGEVPSGMSSFSSKGSHSGTMVKIQGKFGFIKQDSGEEDMFVMPNACFQLRLPEIGVRVTYDVVIDDKTG
eukprot:gnl/MRDRNA2_/MRDRNA2_117771_c0_seq1.p1 gnl/MRDRNA2_/MRDRNA2_117771_c0~~gnl/MRDRNA2_/MRDRNA2_117771_c0_seq1.p1  ORF type:complete len:253 (+),score=60.87 gnl/MRDRNA2_/MRDRNA2_117771_c0_seq1:49-759(+)